VIGKVDRVDHLEFGSARGPSFVLRISATHVDIVAKTLERKDSGLASYISVGDMGLYAEHPLVHGWTLQARSGSRRSKGSRVRGFAGPEQSLSGSAKALAKAGGKFKDT